MFWPQKKKKKKSQGPKDRLDVLATRISSRTEGESVSDAVLTPAELHTFGLNLPQRSPLVSENSDFLSGVVGPFYQYF